MGSAWSGCTDCHGDAATPEVEVRLEATSLEVGSLVVSGGETVDLTLTVASPDPEHLAAGLDVAATAGTLVPGATLLWRKGELSHQFPHPTVDGQQVFSFQWVAPAWATEATIGAAGNAVNYDGSTRGDAWNVDTLAIVVVSDCTDADGDLVGDCEGDCDDGDASVYPGAEETWYDGVDSDCAGDDDDDADGDGVPLSEDCDDSDPERSTAEDCGGTDGGSADGGGTDGGGTDGGSDVVDPVPVEKGCGVVGAGGLALVPWALLVIARRRG